MISSNWLSLKVILRRLDSDVTGVVADDVITTEPVDNGFVGAIDGDAVDSKGTVGLDAKLKLSVITEKSLMERIRDDDIS